MHQQGKINREDMLELTRRMTPERNCFIRIAGAYYDDEGYIDGTFNRLFRNLTPSEQQKNLDIAKAVPFSKTNSELMEYVFDSSDEDMESTRSLLMALLEFELKNDALLDALYDRVGESFHFSGRFAFYVFYGVYDIPLKAKDKTSLWESEEVYSFVICAACPVSGDYEAGKPVSGFLFPAFKDRSSDDNRIQMFRCGGNSLVDVF